jgi:hypothetical protein
VIWDPDLGGDLGPRFTPILVLENCRFLVIVVLKISKKIEKSKKNHFQLFIYRSMKAGNEKDKIGQKTYEVLVSQIWSLLPGFCNNPKDLKESFKSLAQQMGLYLERSKDLRIYIMASIRQLILKNLNNEDHKMVLAKFAKNFLPILFNLYTAKPVGAEESGQRMSVMETVKLYLQITDEDRVQAMFDAAWTKFNTVDVDDFAKESCYDLLRVMLPFQVMFPVDQKTDLFLSISRN